MQAFDDLPKGARVAVAMSGGVDSSATAILFQEAGFDVIGLTLRLTDLPGAQAAVDDAASVAAKLGIPHHVVDQRQAFADHVTGPFAASYLRGETPLPCALCNRFIKFGALVPFARAAGAYALATGHYVARRSGPAGPELHQAADPRRDQSYFLFDMRREDLAFLRFPLAELTKDETRALARSRGLAVAEKPDSQDICFVPGGDYAAAVRALRPDAPSRPGNIVTETGEVVGQHEGIIAFTIGQRRGLNLGLRQGDHNDPLFVVALRPATNEVVVGPRASLAAREVMLSGVNWLADPVPEEGLAVQAKLRSTMQGAPARLFLLPSARARLVFDAPLFGIAKGQAAVAYQETHLLGGGWIGEGAGE